MSPKILEYQGISVKFFSDDHEPIHVHCMYGEYQTKVELHVKEKEVVEIIYKKVKGFKPIPEGKLEDLKVLIETYKNEIVADWINFFVYNTRIEARKINQKLK